MARPEALTKASFSLPEKIRVYYNHLLSDVNDDRSLSQENSKHQSRILGKLVQTKSKFDTANSDYKLDYNSTAAALVISDYGKTEKGRRLLLEQDADSDYLLKTILGTEESKSTKKLKEILGRKFGEDKSDLLNPNLNPDQVREQMGKNGLLPSFYHELPGLLFLFKDYDNNKVNDEQFERILLTNLFHNGPQEGFLDRVLINTLNSLREINLHHNTPFVDGDAFCYPDPQSHESFIHCTFDREDQAIEGLPKLAKEVASFGTLKEQVWGEFLNKTQEWTMAQLKKLKDLYSEFSGKQFEFIDELIKKAQDRVKAFQTYIHGGESHIIRATSEQDDDNSGFKFRINFTHNDGKKEILTEVANNHFEHKLGDNQPEIVRDRKEFIERNAKDFLHRVVQDFKDFEESQAA